jgi:hypothetical protein
VTHPQCYQLLFYKGNGSFAVRERYGLKKQVFTFGCKTVAKRHPELTKGDLEAIGEQVIDQLDRGEVSVDEGRAWCRSQLE